MERLNGKINIKLVSKVVSAFVEMEEIVQPNSQGGHFTIRDARNGG